ncbi:P-loop containing nucleoside triphosphate hydrolase protein [Sistotremastrum niveocremeum HHB9708]|uniref:p-loop containing nucleoside triphosphate hydrolase protein n=1 Tax=Sistotremastrum niveocremeum HHB9708 TaxID=1314777 RepID=A0A164Y327_9AGAM|nr:P-loop containing nucleoside triphosphate hydrolase protein [Sistotremastrum niveocremeum HHB9708]
MAPPVLKDLRTIPLYLSGLSLVLLLFHAIIPETRFRIYYGRLVDTTYDAKFREKPEYREPLITRLLQLMRLPCCIALAVLGYHSMKTGGEEEGNSNLASLIFLSYSALLSLASVAGTKKWRSITSAHLSFTHFVAFCIYITRDVVPLAVEGTPADIKEGAVAWVRLALLGVTGVIIPGLIPRKYYPIDPLEPSEPADSQTASYLSWLFYDFLDPIVYTAFKNTNLQFSDLPVLADDDKAKYLARTGFPTIDPVTLGRKRSIIISLLIHYKKQYALMLLAALVQSVNEFAAPIATNRILASLEPGGENTNIKPWVWILWLGTGPIIGSMCNQIYIYLQNLNVVRVQAILTQLILVHSMRVRLSTVWDKPEESKETSPVRSESETTSTIASETTTPNTDTVSLPESSDDTTIQGSESTTLLPSSSAQSAISVDSVSVSKKDGADKADKEKAEEKKTEDYIGKINNFLTTDSHMLLLAQNWMQPAVLVLRIFFCMGLLYTILGWSALVGMGVMIICLPLPGYIGKMMMKYQRVKMKKSDGRLSAVTQMMNVLRMIKLFAWENKVEKQLAEKREEELKYILWGEMLDLLNGAMNSIFPAATMISTYATYVFVLFAGHLQRLFYLIPGVLRAKVSLERIGEFINNGELYSDLKASVTPPPESYTTDSTKLFIRDATFSWEKPGLTHSSAHSKRRNFRLQIDGELEFHTGSINLICGPTASGKTSLLMALLGEMYFQPSLPTGTFNLPREGGVAYAAQETWVLNETIRENILFGSPYDKERFDKVIYQTGLERDLKLFDAGDMTEVGEKGITLSGGQKARITLARAVYSKAQVVLLDDVLSALDVHTSQWVATKCLGGDLLKGRTVLLVTHNVLLCEPIADYVISLGQDGRIVSKGTVSEALKKNAKLRDKVKADEKAKVQAEIDGALEEEEVAGEATEAADVKKKDSGKLIVAEEMAVGHLSWEAAKLYATSLGGPLFWIVFFVGLTLGGLVAVFQKWFLGYWSSQYESRPTSEVPVGLYLGIYSAFFGAEMFFDFGVALIFTLGALGASRMIHQRLIKSILSSTLRWLDTVPISRVIARCSQDCQVVDGVLPNMLSGIFFITTHLIINFIGVIISAGWPALIPGVIVAVSGITFGQIYIKAQLPIKRHMSNSRSPVLSHVGAALHGLVSIRAYGAQAAFESESLRRIDDYSRTTRTSYNLNRWIAVRMDTLGAVFSATVAAYLVYGRDLNSGSVGFTLSLISAFSSMLLIWVRVLNEVEVEGNSIERIRDFLVIDHEPESTESGKPPAYWPASGELHVQELSAKYSADGPEVLKNITFSLKSGQRMGIVGRTGAGKSTVALALLRAIPTTGSIIYDGRDVSEVNLDVLRSHITIIPQHPELLAGTLRENLDPFGEHDDATLNDALRASGLYHTQVEGAEGGVGLDTDVTSGGTNFSQGQRQILALARAILRRSKIVILDEATAAIDHDTDHAIQESLRTEFKDTTVITVAHRLQTIMHSDKIMVLDAGEAVELDDPRSLLQRDRSFFKSLVDESSDKDALYAAAGL